MYDELVSSSREEVSAKQDEQGLHITYPHVIAVPVLVLRMRRFLMPGRYMAHIASLNIRQSE